jgi:4-hydroxyacetophenone monooxygenase
MSGWPDIGKLGREVDVAEGNLRGRFTSNVGKVTAPAEELRQNLQAAPSNQLLLAAVHVTRDTSLLDLYEDQVVGNSLMRALMNSPGDRTDSPEARADLIELVVRALSQQDQPDYLSVEDLKDLGLLGRMSDVAAGQPVPQAHLAMNLQQCGFEPDQRAVRPTRTPPGTLNLAIIGAGMTGLDAAVKAADRGFDFEVYEMESGTGGLWWSQTYPGVAVDTPSMVYSLSWEVTPNWSRFYPLGDEYRAYLTGIAEKYQLTDHLHFNSAVTRMEWLDAEQVWELTIFSSADHTTRTVRAASVITGAGHLNRPKYPDVEGRESFAGESIHTARWRDVDLAGKRAAVIGVGAAGVQVISSIAPEVGHLTVFQRQAHWISPNRLGDGTVSDSERWLRRHLPYYLQWSRLAIFAQVNSFSHRMNVVDEEWHKNHPLSISPVNDGLMQVSLKYINDTFGEGSELARKLTPDFAFGGKRPVRDPGDFEPGGYYYALSQPHVDVVTDPVARVVPEGIVTADGNLVELDVIVWATGMTLDWLSPVQVVGRDGVILNDVWADNNPRSYLGGTVPGFPNLFVNDGPNTGVATGGAGHNFMTETVDHFIFECLQLMVENGATSIEVTQEAHDAHNERLEQAMAGLIWTHEHGADTYYRNQAGRIILPSPFPPEVYWEMSQFPDPSHFVLRTPASLEGAGR